MGYKTPIDLDKAIKSNAKSSSMDTNRAYVGFFFHRLLCRVFSVSDSHFLLKGGQSVLARTPDARATRDIDLLSEDGDLEQAIDELKALASMDMGDFVTFEHFKTVPIKAEDEYRAGACVSFHVWIGARRVQDISVDLVVDEVPQESFDVLTPADRIEVRDIPVCDYRMYTAESSLADKLCGIVERHDGRPSSRQKDLVDVIVYAMSCEIDGSLLSRRLRLECSARKIDLPDHFEVPVEWRGAGETRFVKLCRQTPLAFSVGGLDAAVDIAAGLFNPVLDGTACGKKWVPALREWL